MSSAVQGETIKSIDSGFTSPKSLRRRCPFYSTVNGGLLYLLPRGRGVLLRGFIKAGKQQQMLIH